MKRVFSSRLFWVGLGLRLILMPYFGSFYLTDLFVPFLDAAVLNPTTNPWTLLAEKNFPYGLAMYLILFIPRYLAYLAVGKAALGTTTLGISLIKLPMLALDILLLVVLFHMAKKRLSVLIYYWLNPIVIYITYIHGQLDLAAMAFCLLSLLYLTRKQIAFSALAMATATLCKFHVVLAIPIILAYLWNRQFARKALGEIGLWVGIWLVVSIAGFLPVITAGRLAYASVSSPEAMRLFSARLTLGSSQALYLGVMGVLFVLGRLVISTRISPLGLVLGVGMSFGTLLMTTDTAPGWFLWFIPFVSLFYSLYLNVPRMLLWAMYGIYLLYFGVYFDHLIPLPEFAYGSLAQGITFTFLQTVLASLLVSMWTLSVRKEALLQRRTRPFMLGIAGGSGSGKNYLSAVLSDLFGEKDTSIIEGDDYHRWERFDENWKGLTHLNPKANSLDAMTEHADDLTKGMPVQKAHYDHSNGKFTQPKETRPAKTVIVQGLHALYQKHLRSHLDLKVFLAPDPLLQLSRKLQRDVGQRGHTPDSVLSDVTKRAQDTRSHIAPQSRYADWVIEQVPFDSTLTEKDVLEGDTPKFFVRHKLLRSTGLENLVTELEKAGCDIRLETDPNDMDRVDLTCYSSLSSSEIALIAERVFRNLRHVTRARKAPHWRDGFDGLSQLIAVSLVGDRMGFNSREG